MFLRNQLFSAHTMSVPEHRVQALGKLMKQPHRIALSHNPLSPTWRNSVFPQEGFVALLEIPLFTSSPLAGQVKFVYQGYSVLASATEFSSPHPKKCLGGSHRLFPLSPRCGAPALPYLSQSPQGTPQESQGCSGLSKLGLGVGLRSSLAPRTPWKAKLSTAGRHRILPDNLLRMT